MFYTLLYGNKRRAWIIPLIFLVHAVLFSPAATGAEEPSLTREQIYDLFSQGKEFFRQANELASTNPQKAKNLYQKSILRFEKIANEGGIRNGRLFYNIGNAYFRRGELGKAILYYKRAERLIPTDSNLRQNLEYARSLRQDKIEEKIERRFLGTLFFWHNDLSLKTKFILFVVFFNTLWLLAVITLFFKKNLTLKVGICGAGILAAALLLSLSIDSFSRQKMKEGVIISAEVVARKGDGESYQPSFKDPLHQGTEFTILEKRSGWWHIRLPDGRECWIPARDAESV